MANLTPGERAQIQADHETFMTSVCTLGISIGWVYDPETDTEVEVIESPYYTGKCKVQSLANRGQGVSSAGGQDVTLADVAVVVPAEITDVAPSHVVQVVDSPDPDLIGKRLTVAGVQVNDFLSARYLSCTLNQG